VTTLVVARNRAHKSMLETGLNNDAFTVAVLGDRFEVTTQFLQAIVCDLHTTDVTFLAKHKAWMIEVVQPHLQEGVVAL
jgi:hypothetical protein